MNVTLRQSAYQGSRIRWSLENASEKKSFSAYSKASEKVAKEYEAEHCSMKI